MNVFLVALAFHIVPNAVLDATDWGVRFEVLKLNKRVFVVNAFDEYIETTLVTNNVQKVTFQTGEIAFINEQHGVVRVFACW